MSSTKMATHPSLKATAPQLKSKSLHAPPSSNAPAPAPESSVLARKPVAGDAARKGGPPAMSMSASKGMAGRKRPASEHPATPPTVPRVSASSMAASERNNVEDSWINEVEHPSSLPIPMNAMHKAPPPKRARPSKPAPTAPSSASADSIYPCCVPPGLDENTFQLLSRMAPNIANVHRWVRPAEVLGDAPPTSPEPGFARGQGHAGPHTAHPGARPKVVSSSRKPRPPSGSATLPPGALGAPPGYPGHHAGAGPAGCPPRAGVGMPTGGPKTPSRTPKQPSLPGDKRSGVPSARCARCALKKKKCTRVAGGICVACSKWANKAPTEDELQRRMQSCKVPLVSNQRGSSSARAANKTGTPQAKRSKVNPADKDQPQFFPALSLMGRSSSISPTSAAASAHSTPRQANESSPSPPLLMDAPLDSALTGIISSSGGSLQTISVQ